MKIIVAGNISQDIKDNLELLGFTVYLSPFCDNVLPPIGYHPDMQAVFINGTLICNPDLIEEYRKIISCSDTKILKGGYGVQSNYPKDVAYNVKVIGDTVFHNFRYTDSVLTDFTANNKKVNVTQGYTGCSMCRAGDRAVITADTIIHQKALEAGMSSLLITPGQIMLPGFDTGFIGGASFYCDGTVYFFGDIMSHSDGKEIVGFCNSNGCDVVCLGNGILFDYGSAVTFE